MLKGSIMKELIWPSTIGIRNNNVGKSVRAPYMFVELQAVKTVASTTRTDRSFEDKRVGNVIRRRYRDVRC